MDFRQGTCTSCKNSFRVPATFAAPKAKCPKCGGVVEIGPVQSGAGARAITKPAPVASAEPAVQPKGETKAEAPVVAKEPTSVPVAAAATPSIPPITPEVLEIKSAPAAEKPAATPAKETVRSATAAAASRVKSSPSAAGSSRRAGAERVARRGAEKADEGDRETRHGVPTQARKAPLIVGAIVLLVVGVGGWYFAVYAPGLKAAEAAEAEKAAKEKESAVDLANIPDAVRLEKTDEGDFQKMTTWMTRYMTPPEDAESVLSGDLLGRRGKEAVPAILNGFKRVDLTTREGNSRGFKIQTQLLQRVCNDANFGWKRDIRPEEVAFNKQVIARWFETWDKFKDDEDAWAAIAKGETPPPPKPAEPAQK